MIPLIRTTLDAVVPDLGAPAERLAFIKYSTPTSGRTLKDKVIFLVFRPGASTPFVCVKTGRSYAARETVARNFANLQKLNALTAGSPHEGLFARALHLYDDGEQVFSIETACPGARVRLDRAMLERVVRDYTAFAAHVATGPLRPLGDTGLRVPHTTELGDLTEDNLLVSSRGIAIVDYDRVGQIDIPGFDLVSLLRRYDKKNLGRLCEEFLPRYFAAIGAEGEGSYDRLRSLCDDAERRLKTA